ncbi:asparaginase domain-containing protein [uncultured Tateyamaria sp.]|uniref:asparaginase domain-containing protein n=1 Tax=uncultured Tateyamaria sp. TaxID=455651 RepID=UPI002638357C|nr:asparaginase domain-containing protein [uncultured Tateyamaria sp.]
MNTENKGVLVIYTGGTIGSMPKDPNDTASPQVVVDWNDFLDRTSVLKEGLGYRLGFAKLSVALDSCDIGPEHWTEMAEIIENNYDDYEGFVILHGTDTMVYTASALSFMLANLAKPVVLTGSQRTHLFQARNDGLQNTITSLSIANPKATGIPVIPEVMICFGTDLLRGNRSKKKDANGYIAYESPKYPNLAKIGANIEVNEARILPIPDGAFFVRKNLELNVIDFNVFPGVVHNGVADLLFDSKSFTPKGAVVRAYGAGNIPTDEKFLARLANASQNDPKVTMINVTQCTQGRVELGLYETSNKLLAFGMVSGTDLTPEAAMVKLMVGLADEDLQYDQVGLRNFLQTNQAGEQSTSIYEMPFPTPAANLSSGKPRFRFPADRDLPGTWEPSELEGVQLRLYGAKVTGPAEDEALEIDVYANLSSNEEPSGPESTKFAGRFRKAPTADASIISFDVTAATRRLFRPGQRSSFSLILASEKGDLEWQRAELGLFVKE